MIQWSSCLELPPNQYDTKNTSWVLLGKLITNKVVGTSIVSDVVNKVWRLVTNNPSESTREQYLHVPFPSWSRYGQCLLQEALVHPRRTPSLKAMESFPHMARDILHIINILGTSARPSKAVEIFEQPPTTRRKSQECYWGWPCRRGRWILEEVYTHLSRNQTQLTSNTGYFFAPT